MLKIASILSYFSGLGFGIPCVYGIWYFIRYKSIATVMGFPSYGNGPFEKIGLHASTPLLISFLLVCVAECIAGQLLWTADKGGAILSLAIIPVEMMFFIGFALPFGPPLLLVRTILVLLSWSSFSSIKP